MKSSVTNVLMSQDTRVNMLEKYDSLVIINQVHGISKEEVIFALCQECFWVATYFKENEKNCPICNAKLTIHRMIVSRNIPSGTLSIRSKLETLAR